MTIRFIAPTSPFRTSINTGIRSFLHTLPRQERESNFPQFLDEPEDIVSNRLATQLGLIFLSLKYHCYLTGIKSTGPTRLEYKSGRH